MVLSDLYDRDGELWKGALPCLFYTTKPHAEYPIRPIEGGQYNYTEEWPFMTHFVMVDMQNVRATIAETPPNEQPQAEWDLETFFNEEGPFTDPALHTVRAFRTVH